MAKYLIIEHRCNEWYAYVENKAQFKKNALHREKQIRLTQKDLDDECWLGSYPDDIHFVFELKEQTRDQVKASKARKGKVSKKKARRKQAR